MQDARLNSNAKGVRNHERRTVPDSHMEVHRSRKSNLFNCKCRHSGGSPRTANAPSGALRRLFISFLIDCCSCCHTCHSKSPVMTCVFEPVGVKRTCYGTKKKECFKWNMSANISITLLLLNFLFCSTFNRIIERSDSEARRNTRTLTECRLTLPYGHWQVRLTTYLYSSETVTAAKKWAAFGLEMSSES